MNGHTCLHGKLKEDSDTKKSLVNCKRTHTHPASVELCVEDDAFATASPEVQIVRPKLLLQTHTCTSQSLSRVRCRVVHWGDLGYLIRCHAGGGRYVAHIVVAWGAIECVGCLND